MNPISNNNTNNSHSRRTNTSEIHTNNIAPLLIGESRNNNNNNNNNSSSTHSSNSSRNKHVKTSPNNSPPVPLSPSSAKPPLSPTIIPSITANGNGSNTSNTNVMLATMASSMSTLLNTLPLDATITSDELKQLSRKQQPPQHRVASKSLSSHVGNGSPQNSPMSSSNNSPLNSNVNSPRSFSTPNILAVPLNSRPSLLSSPRNIQSKASNNDKPKLQYTSSKSRFNNFEELLDLKQPQQHQYTPPTTVSKSSSSPSIGSGRTIDSMDDDDDDEEDDDGEYDESDSDNSSFTDGSSELNLNSDFDSTTDSDDSDSYPSNIQTNIKNTASPNIISSPSSHRLLPKEMQQIIAANSTGAQSSGPTSPNRRPLNQSQSTSSIMSVLANKSKEFMHVDRKKQESNSTIKQQQHQQQVDDTIELGSSSEFEQKDGKLVLISTNKPLAEQTTEQPPTTISSKIGSPSSTLLSNHRLLPTNKSVQLPKPDNLFPKTEVPLEQHHNQVSQTQLQPQQPQPPKQYKSSKHPLQRGYSAPTINNTAVATKKMTLQDILNSSPPLVSNRNLQKHTSNAPSLPVTTVTSPTSKTSLPITTSPVKQVYSSPLSVSPSTSPVTSPSIKTKPTTLTATTSPKVSSPPNSTSPTLNSTLQLSSINNNVSPPISSPPSTSTTPKRRISASISTHFSIDSNSLPFAKPAHKHLGVQSSSPNISPSQSPRTSPPLTPIPHSPNNNRFKPSSMRSPLSFDYQSPSSDYPSSIGTPSSTSSFQSSISPLPGANKHPFDDQTTHSPTDKLLQTINQLIQHPEKFTKLQQFIQTLVYEKVDKNVHIELNRAQKSHSFNPHTLTINDKDEITITQPKNVHNQTNNTPITNPIITHTKKNVEKDTEIDLNSTLHTNNSNNNNNNIFNMTIKRGSNMLPPLYTQVPIYKSKPHLLVSRKSTSSIHSEYKFTPTSFIQSTSSSTTNSPSNSTNSSGSSSIKSSPQVSPVLSPTISPRTGDKQPAPANNNSFEFYNEYDVMKKERPSAARKRSDPTMMSPTSLTPRQKTATNGPRLSPSPSDSHVNTTMSTTSTNSSNSSSATSSPIKVEHGVLSPTITRPSLCRRLSGNIIRTLPPLSSALVSPRRAEVVTSNSIDILTPSPTLLHEVHPNIHNIGQPSSISATSTAVPPTNLVPSSLGSLQAHDLIEPSMSDRFKPFRLNQQPTEVVLASNPTGKVMVIKLLTNWGDSKYIGLTGVDIFDINGKYITLSDITTQLKCSTAIDDDRSIERIVDRHRRNVKDEHLWLVPYQPARESISFTFDVTITIAMIRIWNYNRSLAHINRGAKDIEIRLDNQLIFKGPVQISMGLSGQSPSAEYIVFNNDESVLDLIEQNDPFYSGEIEKDTSAEKDRNVESLLDELTIQEVKPAKANDSCTYPIDIDSLPKGRVLKIQFKSTWGDRYYLGLTSIEIYDENYQLIKLQLSNLTANPKDINDLPGHSGDYRTLDKLIDRKNVTTDDQHMWMIPFQQKHQRDQTDYHLTIDLGAERFVSCLRVWNYNKSVDDASRGAKEVIISLDGKNLSSGYIFRKAPGESNFDFGQTISFIHYNRHSNEPISDTYNKKLAIAKETSIPQDYKTLFIPSGFVFKLVIISSCGDKSYIGLNGMQLFDWNGELIDTSKCRTVLLPPALNNQNNDQTLSRLFDGVNNTIEEKHSWCTPALYPSDKSSSGLVPISICLYFDYPISVSMVKIWNYLRIPSRGVEEFVLYIDDLLLFKGKFSPSPSDPSASVDSKTVDFSQTILFSHNSEQKEKIYRFTGFEQKVNFINNNIIADQRLTK